MDLSGTQTVGVARYDFDKLKTDTLDEEKKKLVELLLSQKHLMYHWGYHEFYIYVEPFVYDYDSKEVSTLSGEKVLKENWIGCDPDDLHELLRECFEGEWGPSAADTLLKMENSGIKVDIYGTEKFGPGNPKKYIEDLRTFVKTKK